MSRFHPCIDLHNGKVKQIVGGTLNDADGSAATNFVAEHPAGYYAEMYKRDRLKGGHVIMLGPNNETAALEALAAFPGGLQLGGGVTLGNARTYLDAGADKVIVTSAVFRGGRIDFEALNSFVALIGRDRLTLDLSARRRNGRYYIVTDRWQSFTETELNRETLEHLAGFCAEYLVHAVDVEGKQAGVDEDVLNIVAHSPIPVTYAGGIRSMADIELIERAGAGKVDYTVGSALDIFGGSLSYSKLVSREQAR